MMAETARLDDFDLRILRVLRDEGRVPVQELSDRVGLSPTPVARRIRALEAAGVITGYAALIDEAAIGFPVSVFVSVKLDRQVDQALVEFERAVQGFPEVVDCWLMTGNRDYLLRVVTDGLAGFEAFLTGRLTRLPSVSSIESSIPLRRVKHGISRQV
jgi:Lrp/AsnC family leucine-responsive transcriptional regulator